MSIGPFCSKEDVEKFKGKDLLEQLLAEMTTEFPGLSQVVIEERDTFLAHSLKMAAEPIHAPNEPKGNQSNHVVLFVDFKLPKPINHAGTLAFWIADTIYTVI